MTTTCDHRSAGVRFPEPNPDGVVISCPTCKTKLTRRQVGLAEAYWSKMKTLIEAAQKGEI